MPTFSGGGGGGFNGGTITQPLKINDPTGAALLDLLGGGTWEVEVDRSDQGGGVVNADLILRADGAGGVSRLRLRDGGGHIVVDLNTTSFSYDSQSNTATDTVLEVSSVFWGLLLDIQAGSVNVDAPLLLFSVPAADPHVVGQVYSVAGVLHVSAG